MKTITTKGVKMSITKMTIAFLFLCTGMNTYGQLYEVRLEQKIEEAEIVVEGEVIESECFRTNAGDIYTAHKLKIYKSFKASPPSEYVSIVTRGGILDNEEQAWTHLLTLNVGAKGIFFLHKTASPPYALEKVTDNYYSVFSSEQGFLKYDWENEMLRAYEPFHQYENVEKDIFDRLQKDYSKSYQTVANNNWSYAEKKKEVIQSFTTQVKNGDKCLDFLFEVMSPDPNNIFQVSTVVSIKATELTHITRPVIALKYSATALGTNIAANNLITLEQIGLSSDINYTSVAQDIAPDKVRIDIQANSLDEPDLFVITDTYTTLIKIHLTLPGPLDPGLLLDQEMMETLSKYFDLEEGIEKYFDCMRITGDFSTFQCPVAVISGFNATSLSDTTIVFPANNIHAGTDDVLIISGVCFGGNQGDSYVEFTNAKNGPNEDEWVRPLEEDYVKWSDEEIMILVPSIGLIESNWYAGSGFLRVGVVNDEPSTATSFNELNVKYTVKNRTFANSAPQPDHTLHSYLINRNAADGYSIYYASNFQNYFGPLSEGHSAIDAFEAALLDWRCTSFVNFIVQDSIDIVSIDNAFRVEFGDLPIGSPTTLGTTTVLAELSCNLPSTTVIESYISELKIVFNDFNGLFSWNTNEFELIPIDFLDLHDLQSVALHELGHAHGLKHVNNIDDIMYFSTPVEYNRDLQENDEDGGVYCVNESVAMVQCSGISPMIPIADCDEGINSITELSYLSNYFTVFPNPTVNTITISLADYSLNTKIISVEIYNSLGSLIHREKPNSNMTFDLSDLSNGIYFLKVIDANNSFGIQKLILDK